MKVCLGPIGHYAPRSVWHLLTIPLSRTTSMKIFSHHVPILSPGLLYAHSYGYMPDKIIVRGGNNLGWKSRNPMSLWMLTNLARHWSWIAMDDTFLNRIRIPKGLYWWILDTFWSRHQTCLDSQYDHGAIGILGSNSESDWTIRKFSNVIRNASGYFMNLVHILNPKPNVLRFMIVLWVNKNLGWNSESDYQSQLFLIDPQSKRTFCESESSFDLTPNALEFMMGS